MTDLRESLRGIESCLTELEGVADSEARERARAVVRAVLDLHGEGLAKILELATLSAPGGAAPTLVDAFARDDLVGSLLLLHGLHPVSLETRVCTALDRVRPGGWTLELVDAKGGVVRVAIACTGDPKRVAQAERVRALVEQAVQEAAPDADGLEIVGGEPTDFVPLERLVRHPSALADAPARGGESGRDP